MSAAKTPLDRVVMRAPWPILGAGALACALALALPGCRRPEGGRDAMPPPRPLTEVLAAHTPELMAVPGVVGTAESRTDAGRPCVLIMVARLTPGLRARLPRTLEGWPVRIEATGEIRGMADPAR